jgi:alpha-D-ribose 1-methylphosphonate 5-triphosphate synthase subunit PhnG
MSDLFGVGGQQLLASSALAPAMRARVNSCSRLIEALDFEVEVFTDLATHRLASLAGLVGGLGAVFQLGDVTASGLELVFLAHDAVCRVQDQALVKQQAHSRGEL